MAALQSEDTSAESEIVFSSLPTLDQVVEVPEKNPEQLPQHIEYLKSKLKQQQRRKQLLAEQERRMGQMETLIGNTRALNQESETLNTQAAVLLSALGKLQQELDAGGQAQRDLHSEFIEIRADSHSLLEELGSAREESRELHRATSERHDSAGELIQQLQSLLSQGKRFQSDNQAAADRIADLLADSERHNAELAESSANFRDLGEQAQHVIELAGSSLAETEQQAAALKGLVSSNRAASTEFQDLSSSLHELQDEMRDERGEQQQLNERTRNQLAELDKLALQQTTMIEMGSSRVDTLKQELESVLQISKKYQSRLVASDERLRDAIAQQELVSKQHDEALARLQSNELIMKEASSALEQSSQQGARFGDALSCFQRTSEQSQQIVLRSQASLESLLSRNHALEQDNRLLSDQLHHLGSIPSANQGAQLEGVEDLNLTGIDNQPEPAVENKDGFYKLLMLLAIVLPLSFIAHSIISIFGGDNVSPTNVGYESPFQPASESREILIDSPLILPNTAADSYLANGNN